MGENYSCGKRRYSSEMQAIRANQQRGLSVPGVRKCPVCKGYRLTSRRGNATKRVGPGRLRRSNKESTA